MSTDRPALAADGEGRGRDEGDASGPRHWGSGMPGNQLHLHLELLTLAARQEGMQELLDTKSQGSCKASQG